MVDTTLEVFDQFISNSSSGRLFAKLDIVKQLLQNHILQFNILGGDPKYKHFCTFFKILTNLWLHEDYIEGFNDYISQLNLFTQEIFKLDDA